MVLATRFGKFTQNATRKLHIVGYIDILLTSIIKHEIPDSVNYVNGGARVQLVETFPSTDNLPKHMRSVLLAEGLVV